MFGFLPLCCGQDFKSSLSICFEKSVVFYCAVVAWSKPHTGLSCVDSKFNESVLDPKLKTLWKWQGLNKVTQWLFFCAFNHISPFPSTGVLLTCHGGGWGCFLFIWCVCERILVFLLFPVSNLCPWELQLDLWVSEFSVDISNRK